jgi:putative ABC transport system ATP-binding protein
MIKIENLNKVFRTDQVETTALNDIHLTINKGEFVAIMGPSGCGKSTLLNILGLLDVPSSGDYYFDNQNVARYSETALAKIRKNKVGFIFQSFNLIDELTVFENIEIALIYNDIPSKIRKEKIDQVLKKLEILHRAKHFPHQLSGGQQQRVAIARALVANPDLLLADEPTGNLDSIRGQEIMQILQQLNAEGTSIIMVTHSQEHANYARRQIHLFDGKLISETHH